MVWQVSTGRISDWTARWRNSSRPSIRRIRTPGRPTAGCSRTEEENPGTGLDIWIYSIDARTRKVFLRTPYNESKAEFSPDGRFIAYESGEAGGANRGVS